MNQTDHVVNQKNVNYKSKIIPKADRNSGRATTKPEK